MAKKYKRGNSVTQSVEYCQNLVGKIVAVRDEEGLLIEKVTGVQVYLSHNGVQSVKLHFKGTRGYYHLDDLVFVYP